MYRRRSTHDGPSPQRAVSAGARAWALGADVARWRIATARRRSPSWHEAQARPWRHRTGRTGTTRWPSSSDARARPTRRRRHVSLGDGDGTRWHGSSTTPDAWWPRRRSPTDGVSRSRGCRRASPTSRAAATSNWRRPAARCSPRPGSPVARRSRTDGRRPARPPGPRGHCPRDGGARVAGRGTCHQGHRRAAVPVAQDRRAAHRQPGDQARPRRSIGAGGVRRVARRRHVPT